MSGKRTRILKINITKNAIYLYTDSPPTFNQGHDEGLIHHMPSAPPPPPNDNRNYDVGDEDSASAQLVKGFDFTDQTIRRGFIRKVYFILTVCMKSRILCVFVS